MHSMSGVNNTNSTQESQIVKSIRSRYLLDTPSSTPFAAPSNPSLLEQEMNAMRSEIDKLRETINKMKSDEQSRSQRAREIESDRLRQMQQARDDLMRDVGDLARGNRLLSQENDSLNDRYANLQRAHNRVIYGDESDRISPIQELADTYLTQIKSSNNPSIEKATLPTSPQQQQPIRKEDNPILATLTAKTQSNQRLIQEAYSAFKGSLLKMQTNNTTSSNANPKTAAIAGANNEDQSWKEHATFLQEIFERVFRLTESQTGLNEKIISNLSAKNLDSQSKLHAALAQKAALQQQLVPSKNSQSQMHQQQLSQQSIPAGAAWTFSPNNNQQDSPFFAGAALANTSNGKTEGNARTMKKSSPQILVSPPSFDRNPEDDEAEYNSEDDNDNNHLKANQLIGDQKKKKKKKPSPLESSRVPSSSNLNKTTKKQGKGQQLNVSSNKLNVSSNKLNVSSNKLNVSGISRKSGMPLSKKATDNKQPSMTSISRQQIDVLNKSTNSGIKGATLTPNAAKNLQTSLYPKVYQ